MRQVWFFSNTEIKTHNTTLLQVLNFQFIPIVKALVATVSKSNWHCAVLAGLGLRMKMSMVYLGWQFYMHWHSLSILWTSISFHLLLSKKPDCLSCPGIQPPFLSHPYSLYERNRRSFGSPLFPLNIPRSSELCERDEELQNKYKRFISFNKLTRLTLKISMQQISAELPRCNPWFYKRDLAITPSLLWESFELWMPPWAANICGFQ